MGGDHLNGCRTGTIFIFVHFTQGNHPCIVCDGAAKRPQYAQISLTFACDVGSNHVRQKHIAIWHRYYAVSESHESLCVFFERWRFLRVCVLIGILLLFLDQLNWMKWKSESLSVAWQKASRELISTSFLPWILLDFGGNMCHGHPVIPLLLGIISRYKTFTYWWVHDHVTIPSPINSEKKK